VSTSAESVPPTISAPWTPEQVVNADAWQHYSGMHPYTCGNREGHPEEAIYGDHGVLRPTVRGWVCAFCDYTQTWAHPATLNEPPPLPCPHGRPSWRVCPHCLGVNDLGDSGRSAG
jgi:hypothetical protein